MFFKKTDLARAVKDIRESKEKVLIYHRDADGVCSAALLMKKAHSFKTIPREGPIIDDDFMKKLVEMKPDLIMVLDIPIDQEWKKLVKLKKQLKGTKMLVIDHHLVEKNLNSLGILHMNPKLGGKFRKQYIPASCLLYHTLNGMGYDVRKYVWISAMGIIGDYGFEDCSETLKECERENPGSLDLKNVFNSRLSKLTDMISALMTLKGLKGAQESLKMLTRAEHYEELLENGKLQHAYRIVEDEKRMIGKEFPKKAEFFRDEKLIIYEIRSRLNITSIIATRITEKYPNDVLIIRKESAMGWKISLRCQSGKVNVGDLAKKASKGIGSGGGHFKSAGALVRDWELFKKRVLKML